MAVEFKRSIRFVFDFDDELRRIVNVLQYTKASSAERPIKWRRTPNESPSPHDPANTYRASLKAWTFVFR